MGEYTVTDRTDNYTPGFRAGEGWQELWSVDFDGETVGVLRRYGSVWHGNAYNGKRPDGWARHVFVGTADSSETAAELVKEFHSNLIGKP
jgi:hypothetical protein